MFAENIGRIGFATNVIESCDASCYGFSRSMIRDDKRCRIMSFGDDSRDQTLTAPLVMYVLGELHLSATLTLT